MADHIPTTHVGSLPRPEKLIAFNHKRALGGAVDEAEFNQVLKEAVAEVVRRQKEVGIDLVNDGELGHVMGWAYDYGAWWAYVVRRLAGLTIASHGLRETTLSTHINAPMAPNDFVVGNWGDRRDRVRFREAYMDPQSGCNVSVSFMSERSPLVTGPIRYAGHDEIKRDIDNLKAGLEAAGLPLEGAWIAAVAPASCARVPNDYYRSEEELLYACADAMREEYKAIIDAGLIVQLDDPAIAENWDQQKMEPSVEGYRRYTTMQIEALNHAIKGLPADRIRFHLCWGSWHGPHSTDLPMKHLIDLMLKIDCNCYSFEAANVRHEHEWKLWKDVKLPEGKKILPGVVSHSTNLIEDPELVADRICRFAECVGRDNVIASTDCGLGGRVHPQIAWAKLKALSDGAALATRRLWQRAAA
ncbi:MAG TPA: cobalamin-independent methionine synthase II family protein [Hyphomicrobiales bacterium]|nr:cobalamin-independent methionine synthase II family protein [Hyphomicrobiales bacterium]